MKQFAISLACTLFATVCLADCSTPIPVPQEYKQSQTIIIGTVESSHRVPQTWDSFDGTAYDIRIDQKVKGKQSGEINVFSEHSADGHDLRIGTQYLLFLNYDNQHWTVNKCGNSGPLDDAGGVIKQIAHMLGND